ncbi:MAG: response regulator [Sporolactobacillus sp.]
MRVIICDDQVIVREGLKMLLSLHDELEIVAEAKNGQDLLDQLKRLEADVILMDIRMPIMDGIEATKAVKALYPQIKIIILTTFNEDEYIINGLRNGADGYILKDAGSEEIVSAIKAAKTNSMLLNDKIALKVISALRANSEDEAVAHDSKLSLLTQREKDVANELKSGKSNKAIGQDLFITEGTVKNYVSRILDKLELSNRSELVIYMQNNSSIGPGSNEK